MSKKQLINHSKRWDQTGVLLSAICMIHCVSLPAFLGLSPFLSNYFKNEWVHFALHFGVIGVALLSLVASYKRHKNILPLMLGSFGIGVLLTSYILGDIINHSYHSYHLWPNAVGSFLILSAHIWNIRACHCFCETDCSHPEHESKKAKVIKLRQNIKQ